MYKRTILLIIATCSVFSAFAQHYFDIEFPNANRDAVCQKYIQLFNQRPKEVGFSIVKDENNTLFFQTNSKEWFQQLFKNAGDGLAVDIVSKDRYNCSEDEIEKSQIKGHLLKPVYSSALHKILKQDEKGMFKVRLGSIPADLIGKDLEFNILFLSNKNLCLYYNIYDIKSYQWELLDMGFYLDSLTYKTKLRDKLDQESYTLKYKTLKFKIPFQKNKSEYSQEDIKPLYDSLRLTDFNIKKIHIRAYSSIEGNLERNIELQEQRANSIVSAMQSFQQPTIVTEVNSSENWVEFLNDITGTEYENYKELSKAQIKSKLANGSASDLEKYLKNHRKAIISLELEKKDPYNKMTADELMSTFNKTIIEDNLDNALAIQNSLFERLKGKEKNPDFLQKMIVPKQLKFVQIFNKNSAFRALMDIKQLLISYNDFLELSNLSPKDPRIQYNLIAAKIQLWRFKALPIKEETLKKEILELKNFDIKAPLIKRMMVNFHITKSELLMQKRDYINKDKSVAYIYENYKSVPLTDYDYLSLAQYLSYYSNHSKAIKILEDKVKSIEVDENLLFYYINLTLIDTELTQTPDYRTTMLNALNMNKEKFCRLFNPSNDGGVTFQLLEDDYLRNTYCENCTK